MFNNWLNIIFYWCVNFLENISIAMGVTYEALNVWLFVVMVPAVLGISMAINLYFLFRKKIRNKFFKDDMKTKSPF